MAFDYLQGKAFFRDKFVPFNQANVSIASSPVLYGLSIYTVFNCCWNEKQQKLFIYRLEEHYKRLVGSANIMDFHTFAEQWPYEKFATTIRELINHNNVKEDVLVRVTVFIDELIAGTKIHGLKISFSAYIYPAGELLPKKGVNLCVSSWIRNMDNSIPAKAKINGSYVNASLMKNEALMNGYDDAIALDHNGHVAESTVANLFIVRNGKLATPDTSTDILEGITRDSLLEIASKKGIEIQERSIDRTELYKSEEAFLCGSSVGVVPILSIDKRTVGNGQIGPLTAKLSDDYNAIQRGDDSEFTSWLTEV